MIELVLIFEKGISAKQPDLLTNSPFQIYRKTHLIQRNVSILLCCILDDYDEFNLSTLYFSINLPRYIGTEEYVT